MVRRSAIEIGGRVVGAGEPLFAIAEIGLNHGGSVDRALALVDAAAAAKASAIKLQTLVASELVTADAPAPAHVGATSMAEFFARFELDESAHRQVVDRARRHGLLVLATPLSLRAVDMLERVGVDAYKIASGDITWMELIRKCAATGKPLVMSTGMAALDEVCRAVRWAQPSAGVALMHCVSAYPVPRGSENLRAILTLARSFGSPVGLSDHGHDGFSLPIAVALGASLYERHIMLAAGDGSIDADVSSTPAELAAMIQAAERARDTLGTGEKVCLPAERPNLVPSRRALYASRPLRAGAIIAPADLMALRPGRGLTADRQPELVGRRISRDMDTGTPFEDSDVVSLAKGDRRAG
jgi:sialic acid synthase SpsE